LRLEEEQAFPTPNPIARWEWVVLVCILLAGGLLRFTYLQEIRQAPDFAHPGLDPEYYDYWARALNTGDWTQPKGQADPLIPDIPFLRAPGYPYFLAGVYFLTGMSYLGARIVQMGLGLLSTVLIFFLARALYGRAVALVAAAFMSVYWIFIYFEGELNAPALSVFLILCLIHALYRWDLRKTGFRLAIVGVWIGLQTIVRAEGTLMVPVVAAWAWWAMGSGDRTNRTNGTYRTRVGAVLCLFLGFVVTIAPVTIRNYIKEHDLVLICMSGGINLYAGNNELADGTWPQVDLRKTAGIGKEFTNYDIPLIVRGLKKKLGREDITYAGFSRYYRDLALQYMRERPLDFVRLLARKAVLFWSPYEVSNNKVIYFEKQNSLVLRYMPGFPFALGLFIVGLALFLKDEGGRMKDEKRPAANLLHPSSFYLSVLFLLYIATQYVTIVPFHITARYRVTIMPFLLLFGAYGVCRIGSFITERDFRKALAWTLAAAGLIGICHIPLVSYQYDEAKWHNDRAEAYSMQGNYGQAEQELRQAIKANPAPALYYTQLANVLGAQGRFDEAVPYYAQAVEINPQDGLTLNNFGYAFYRQGKTDQAAEFYKRAVAENPFLPVARFNLGYLLLDRGDYEGAIEQFSAVRKADPSNQHVDYNLGRAMAKQGKTREAMAYFNAALALHPKNPQILNDMATLLVGEGKIEDAAALYQEILRQDPANANAHFNMAVTLEAMGKLDEAIEYYRKALALNPEDAAARERLEKALKEKAER